MKKQQQQQMKKLTSLLLLILVTTTFAQQKQVEGKIANIQEDGLYKIQVPHLLRSYSREDLSDFRIWDAKGNQVPYFVHTGNKETRISNFSEFTLISKSSLVDTTSTYIFQNPNSKIEKAVLDIANYQGSKSYNLQGSHDQKEWFGIVNNKQLFHLNSTSKIKNYQVIHFPLCAYQFLKIVFNDAHSLPINLLSMGEATTEIIKSPLVTIPTDAINFSSDKINKTTKIGVQFEHPEIINELHFTIYSPELYNRKARLYVLKEKTEKHEIKIEEHVLSRFVIHSNTDTHFTIPSFYGKELYIEIENEDNPKLTIESLQFLQTPLYVVADLKHTETYTISSGDTELKAPSYDISSFKNLVSENMLKTSIIDVIPLVTKPVVKAQIPFWQKPWFMWLCICITTVVVVFFASSLLKDMKG